MTSIAARAVETFEDLFHIFDRLERGESVFLGPPSSVEFAPRPFPCSAESPMMGIQTSGSTGKRKLVWRRWRELKSELRLSERRSGWRWGSPFRPDTFAGVQVALEAWASCGSVQALPRQDWRHAAALLAKLEAVSATPTYMDLLLLNRRVGSRSVASLRQLTLGGEPLRASVGARLGSAFPDARLTVIYASTELGVLLKTRRCDGWYEIASLTRRHPRWRVDSGQLEVWRDGGWRETGDRVQTRGGLIRVLGRADALANVAGTKVDLEEVRAAVEQIEGIRDAQAWALPSPLTGQIVALRVWFHPGLDPSTALHRAQSDLRARLVKEAWPRYWETGAPSLGPNAKANLRGEGPSFGKNHCGA